MPTDAVVLLDVDGVLHGLLPSGLCRDADLAALTARTDAELDLDETATASVVPGEFNAQCMGHLSRCVAAAGARIVLSSTWREKAPQRRAVDAQLRLHGLPAHCGCTPMLPLVDGGGRAAEILAWVAEHRPAAWVAIDDADLSAKLPEQHFHRTDPARGLTGDDASRVIALFASQQQPADPA